jgi:hypothetical protein
MTMIRIASLHPGAIETQRPRLDESRVRYDMEHLDELDPIIVYGSNDTFAVADGYHRVEAALRLGRTTINAVVRPGSIHDATRYRGRIERTPWSQMTEPD